MANYGYSDFDDVARVGYPWHGLYRAGRVTLKNGLIRDFVGVPPVGADAFQVKIPSQPEVVTSVDDQALGMQWLNYGIVSGRNHIFYGAELGDNSWIYIDSSNKPWLVSASFDANGSGQLQFADFNKKSVKHTLNVALSDPQNIRLEQTSEVSHEPVFLDCSSSGRCVIFSWQRKPAHPFYAIPADEILSRYRFIWSPGAFGMLTIQGVPPACQIVFSVVASSSVAFNGMFSTIDPYEVDYGAASIETHYKYETLRNGAWEPAGTTAASVTVSAGRVRVKSIVGFVFSDVDALLPVLHQFDSFRAAYTKSYQQLPSRSDFRCLGEFSGASTSNPNLGSPFLNPSTVPPLVTSFNLKIGDRVSTALSVTGDTWSISGYPLNLQSALVNADDGWRIGPVVRYSNKAYGLMLHNAGSHQIRYTHPQSWSSGGDSILPTVQDSIAPPRAAAHPVSGQVHIDLASDAPAMCFV